MAHPSKSKGDRIEPQLVAAHNDAGVYAERVDARLGQFSASIWFSNRTSGVGWPRLFTLNTAVARDVRGTLTRLDTSAVLLNEDLRALQRNWLFRRYFKEQAKEQKKLEKAAE